MYDFPFHSSLGYKGAPSRLFKKSLNSSAGRSSFENMDAKLKLKAPSLVGVLVGVVGMLALAAPLGVVLSPDLRGVVLRAVPLGVVLVALSPGFGEGLGKPASSSRPPP